MTITFLIFEFQVSTFLPLFFFGETQLAPKSQFPTNNAGKDTASMVKTIFSSGWFLPEMGPRCPHAVRLLVCVLFCHRVYTVRWWVKASYILLDSISICCLRVGHNGEKVDEQFDNGQYLGKQSDIYVTIMLPLCNMWPNMWATCQNGTLGTHM